jgi:hypothetical protein
MDYPQPALTLVEAELLLDLHLLALVFLFLTRSGYRILYFINTFLTNSEII